MNAGHGPSLLLLLSLFIPFHPLSKIFSRRLPLVSSLSTGFLLDVPPIFQTSYFPAPCVFLAQDVLAGSVRPAGWCQPALHQSGESLALGALHLPCHGAGGCS